MIWTIKEETLFKNAYQYSYTQKEILLLGRWNSLRNDPQQPHYWWLNINMTVTCDMSQIYSKTGLYLISVVDIGIRQTSWHQLKQNHSVSINIRLEGVRVSVLHSDDFGSLKKKNRRFKAAVDKLRPTEPSQSFLQKPNSDGCQLGWLEKAPPLQLAC